MKIGKFKISKTWLVILVIILLFAGYSFLKSAFKNPADGYATEKISAGEVLQEVSETGSVKATQDINLGFKTIGKILSINVSVGDFIKKGDVLAQLDSSQILAQLQSAKAGLNSASNQYEKLLNGSTQEDIKVYQDAVTSARNDLDSAYSSSLNTMNDAYIKVYNAYVAITPIQNAYFIARDQQGFIVGESKDRINERMKNLKNYLDKALLSSNRADTDIAISEILEDLGVVLDSLSVIRAQCETDGYYSKVPSADKTTLDTHKSNISTIRSTLTTSQSSINSYKIALQKAESNLSFKTAQPRREDVDVSQSQIQQAEADVSLYQSQLEDTYLRSPIAGRITEINVKRGETISPGSPVVNLLSTEPFQIKANIYEQDVVNVKVGDSVKINLVAFPRQTFSGKVLSVDPAEKIVDNVVYYEVTIEFANQPEGIRSGMTADIVIETSKKENVLRISKNAVYDIDNKYSVQIITNGKIETREIAIGLEGNDYYEIVSGLVDGEVIIAGKK